MSRPAPGTRLVTRLRRAAWTLLALGIMAFLIVGANRPANPRIVPPGGAPFRGFGSTAFTIRPGPGLSRPSGRRCALLATTLSQQERGLMGQRSLHGYAGMIFEFSQPTSVGFYMKDTPMRLSIAWFDDRGLFIGSEDMDPCPATAYLCPSYVAGPKFEAAIEVPRGQLGPLGIGHGSVLQLTGPCS